MNIVQAKGYYMLLHSFRKSGVITTRTRYLGKTIPKDVEQRKEKFLRQCLKEDAFKKIESIQKKFRKEWKTYPETIKEKMLLDLSIDFTYNTNAIEGSTITLEETEDLIKRKISPQKDIRDVQETINHARTFFEVLNEKRSLSLPILIQWHNDIFHDTKNDIAGTLRQYHVKVGTYMAPDWQDVEQLIKEFVVWYRKNEGVLNPVEFSARVHYKFEKIHPFGDGNGRIGRLLIAYTLQRAHYALMIIEYKKRKQYYHALTKTEHDFVNYFIQRYIRVHKRYLEKEKN
ncbi:Fic family protein [Candidatus Woesearchaeota archaeon]|nr:Fic family protein [Candidatus Woesearchaeota archaeon]